MKALQTVIFVLVLVGFTNAAVFTVTRSDDRDAACVSGVDCSLREAVSAASQTASDDIINFDAGISTITLTKGSIFFAPPPATQTTLGSLTIIGRGANVFTITTSTQSKLFNIQNSIVNVSNVTLTGALSVGDGGGAIYSGGSRLTLDSVNIKGNRAGNTGGGIASGGGVSVLYPGYPPVLVIRNSTFTGNSAQDCGAIVAGGTLMISNTTISGNFSTASFRFGGGNGGALCTGGNATLRNVTITNNSSLYSITTQNSGGVYVSGGTFNFGNTIISGNSAVSGGQPEISFFSGSIVSAGNNLIGDSAGDSTNTLNPVTYHPSDKLDTPPLLGSLLNNGGRTPTHSLLLGSPAIDAGNNALAADPFDSSALVYDQRGANFTRTVDGNSDGTSIVDIGAFETQSIAAASVSIAGRVIDSLGRAVSGAVISMTNRQGQTVSARTNFFGFYRFNAVATGNDYTFEIRHKKYKFNVQTTNIRAELATLDFTALP